MLAMIVVVLSAAPPVVVTRPEMPVPPLIRPRPPAIAKPRFAQRRLARPAQGEGTPLVFSATKTLTLRAAVQSFDFEPGQPTFTAWPDAQTAWLVRDLDGDGEISSGRELFGSFTRVGSGLAKNGFEALAALDSDGDGAVTPRDAAYGELRFWFDRDGDHHVGPGELEGLGDRSLPVRFHLTPSVDRFGNRVLEAARLRDGWLLDVHLVMSRASW